MRKNLEILTLILAPLSFVVSIWTWRDSVRQNYESTYVAALNTRIATCTALSDFHKGMEAKAPLLTDQGKEESSPAARMAAEASIARALTLCIAKNPAVAELRACVAAANGSRTHFVHDSLDHIPGKVPRGADNLAC